MSLKRLEKFHNAVSKVNNCKLIHINVPSPREIVPRPSAELEDLYVRYRSVSDLYIAKLGAEASDYEEDGYAQEEKEEN